MKKRFRKLLTCTLLCALAVVSVFSFTQYSASAYTMLDENTYVYENNLVKTVVNKSEQSGYIESKNGYDLSYLDDICGEVDIEDVIQFGEDGYVDNFYVTKCGDGYTLHVYGCGPSGGILGLANGYLKFYDATGDSYSLRIFSTTFKEHTVGFHSDDPRIVKVEWFADV